jgi:hypothetical protein
VLEAFSRGSLKAAQAAEQLGLSRSRLYALCTAYLRARARKQGSLWIPGRSGGDHATPWPQPVLDLLDKRLNCTPPCPYSFVASEARRLHAFPLDRAQVRRWALENNLAHAVPAQKIPAAVRRWQRHRIGELWQLDASPHRWFPHSKISTTAAASSPAPDSMSANCCSPISTSCPRLSWRTAAPCNSTSITTASFSRTIPTR